MSPALLAYRELFLAATTAAYLAWMEPSEEHEAAYQRANLLAMAAFDQLTDEDWPDGTVISL